MEITRQIIVFDAADLADESTFWAGLLGGTVVADDDWHSVVVDGEWRPVVQLAPNHGSPDWPDGTPQQMHLDLHVDDLKAAHEEAISRTAADEESKFTPNCRQRGKSKNGSLAIIDYAAVQLRHIAILEIFRYCGSRLGRWALQLWQHPLPRGRYRGRRRWTWWQSTLRS